MADNIPIGDESGESWNIVPSMDVQADTVSNLVNSMAASNLAQPPSGPDGGNDKASPLNDLLFGKGQTLGSDLSNPDNKLSKVNSDVVTRAVANQGQLLPIPSQQKNSSSDDGTKKIIAAIQQAQAGAGGGTDTTNPAPAQKSGGGGGDILGDIGTAVSAVAMWIICTELVNQKKMPLKWYIAGGPVFAAYPEIGKRGYYLWAIPSVHHLRRSPDSLYSRFLTAIFLWRAENIAACRGVRGARKLIRGAAVTAILYPVCIFLGCCLLLLGRTPDWKQVYGAQV